MCVCVSHFFHWEMRTVFFSFDLVWYPALPFYSQCCRWKQCVCIMKASPDLSPQKGSQLPSFPELPFTSFLTSRHSSWGWKEKCPPLLQRTPVRFLQHPVGSFMGLWFWKRTLNCEQNTKKVGEQKSQLIKDFLNKLQELSLYPF